MPRLESATQITDATAAVAQARTYSKGDTLIHEMSHFNVVAGTDDVVYGQTGASNLAISDPAGALNNADSRAYFADNQPSQN